MLRHAIRSFTKTPFLTIVAVISLALGMGANAAMFSLFHQILLRALPAPDASRLVNLSWPGPRDGYINCGFAGDCDSVFSYPMFRDLERQQMVFTGIAAHVRFVANLSYERQTMSARGEFVSGSYFPVLNLTPALGRLLGPGGDEAIDEPHVVVLSHSFWRTRFAESPEVLNRTLIVNGQPMTIVGVAPRGFDGTTVGSKPQVFVPITTMGLISPNYDGFENRMHYDLYLFARLKPEMSIERAAAGINIPYRAILNDVEAPLQKMTAENMEWFKAAELDVQSGSRGQSILHTEASAPLNVLFGVTVFVLLIACANVANLLLARGAARAGEMAVRLSLGGSRRHLIMQLLTESCVLAVLGGIVGLLVALWTQDLMATLIPADVAALDYRIDTTLLLFTGGLTLGTGILFGLFPALHSTRPDLLSTLRANTGQTGGGLGAKRFRTVIATSQIALSMALLVLAGLFTKSLFNLGNVDLGFRADNVITFRISPALNGYTPERALALFERIEDDLAAMPGVTGVTASTVRLLANEELYNLVYVPGFPSTDQADIVSMYSLVGSGYLRTLGIPLISGREFTLADAVDSPYVAIVNEQFVKKFNLGRDAVGKRFKIATAGDTNIEIVGIAQNSKYSAVKQEIPPVFFMPYRQHDEILSMSFYVRTSGDPQQLLGTIPPLVSRIGPDLPVEALRTLPQQVSQNVTVDRVVSVLSAAFAGLATLLAAVGLYGVLAYTIAQQTKEIGVRMALGAAPGRIRAMVLRQVGLMTVIGGVIGLFAAIGIGRLAESLLFQLNGHDATVLGAAAILLVLVSLGAGFIPAHRAGRVDPMHALRYE